MQKFKSGFKERLGVSVRSGWEYNILLWLEYQGIAWEYEPRRFIFEDIKQRNTRIYTPDIYLPEVNGGTWIEVKGWLKNGSATKMKRFAKYYPEEFKKLVAIVGQVGDPADKFFKRIGVPIMAYYRALDKQYQNIIPGWNE